MIVKREGREVWGNRKSVAAQNVDGRELQGPFFLLTKQLVIKNV